MMRAKVLRPFLVKGERVEVDAVVELPDQVAMEMKHVGKVELINPPKPAPMTLDNSSALVAGAGVKGKKAKPDAE